MKATILITLLCALISFEAYTGNIGVDPTGGTAGITSGSGGLTLGWEFQVSAGDGIVVDGLGFWDDQADGFLFGQTFDVGLWDPMTGSLLRESLITSSSSLRASVDPTGAWRVNAVSPLYLAPGSYRIGALMPVSGANAIISDPATFQAADGISFA